MEVPRGFTRCAECEGKDEVKFCPLCNETHKGTPPYIGCTNHRKSCPSCSGSGLLPTFDEWEDIRPVTLRDKLTGRGWVLCERCEGSGIHFEDRPGHVDETLGCPHCFGSGLVPTEELRHAVAGCLRSLDLAAYPKERYYGQADAVLRKVAEHIGEER